LQDVAHNLIVVEVGVTTTNSLVVEHLLKQTFNFDDMMLNPKTSGVAAALTPTLFMAGGQFSSTSPLFIQANLGGI
jgi:hypothetical protein